MTREEENQQILDDFKRESKIIKLNNNLDNKDLIAMLEELVQMMHKLAKKDICDLRGFPDLWEELLCDNNMLPSAVVSSLRELRPRYKAQVILSTLRAGHDSYNWQNAKTFSSKADLARCIPFELRSVDSMLWIYHNWSDLYTQLELVLDDEDVLIEEFLEKKREFQINENITDVMSLTDYLTQIADKYAPAKGCSGYVKFKKKAILVASLIVESGGIINLQYEDKKRQKRESSQRKKQHIIKTDFLNN